MDPITIGLAFTAAQSAVGHIKQAIALGKDINGIIGDMGNFFEAADAVHTASLKAKINNIGKSDAQLSRQALEFAMHSNKLREDERALKDMIYWQLGKPQIWEDMIKERTRLLKEKRDNEEALQKAEQAHKEKMANYAMTAFYIIGFSITIIAFVLFSIQIYSLMEEQKQYELKKARHDRIVKEQHYLRSLENKN